MSIFLFLKIKNFYTFFKCKSCFSAYNLSFAKPSTFCETVHFAGSVPRIQKEAFLAALCSKGGHRSREVASPIKNQKVTHFQNATLFRALVRAWGMVPGLGITSLGFWANRSFFAKKWANEWFHQKTSDLLIRSLLVSNLSKLLMVAHFWWETWAICSHCSFLK